jgi:hypothetical protein
MYQALLSNTTFHLHKCLYQVFYKQLWYQLTHKYRQNILVFSLVSACLCIVLHMYSLVTFALTFSSFYLLFVYMMIGAISLQIIFLALAIFGVYNFFICIFTCTCLFGLHILFDLVILTSLSNSLIALNSQDQLTKDGAFVLLVFSGCTAILLACTLWVYAYMGIKVECIKVVNISEVEEQECSVCLDSLTNFVIEETNEITNEENILKLRCAHMFHQECLVQWFKEQLTCPMCRAKI